MTEATGETANCYRKSQDSTESKHENTPRSRTESEISVIHSHPWHSSASWQGKSPTELMTGQEHPHWLELLGFELFQSV